MLGRLRRLSLLPRPCVPRLLMSSSAFQWEESSASLRQESVARFNAFLRGGKAQLQELLETPSDDAVVHVLIGNEAADADSIISSLVYAYYRDHVAKLEASAERTMFIPVLPIPRDELVLRCDVSSLFQSLGVDVSSILFVNEFPWRHALFKEKQRLRMTLLDHNSLNTKRIAAEVPADELAEIVEILDHHMDIGSHAHAPHREIAFVNGQALVASCCTIVAEKVLESKHLDHHVLALASTLLLAVIALDSVNFDPAAKKVTPRDIAAANKLEALSFSKRGALFKWLQAEKFNVAHWSAFTITNCLQCDYKEFSVPGSTTEKYGVSAILIPIDQFIRKAASADAFIETLQSYCDANSLSFLVIMSMVFFADGSRRREILFYESGGDLPFTKKCVDYFLHEGSLQLEKLVELPLVHGDSRITAFNQKNTGASRKQVVPLIQQALAPSSL